jgi:type I restriction enzyme, S subunit
VTELPRGWARSTIGELAETSLGKMLDAKQQTGEHPTSYLRNINVRWGAFDLDDIAVMDIEPHQLDRVLALPGDVIACEGGEPGRCAVWTGEPIALQKALHRIRPAAGINPEYLAFALAERSSTRQLDRLFTGTTIKHLPQEKLQVVPVAVAPTAEQERIVASIEEAFSKLDAGEAGLHTVRQLLKRMRDAILSAAVTGRLVPQDPTDTSATKLLADLGIEFTSEPALEVPATWAVVRLRDLLSEPLANGRSVRSRAGGFPVLRLTCLKGGRIDLGERKDGEWNAAEAAPFHVRKGDFLVSRGNGSLDLVGRGGLVVDEPDPVAYPDTLIRVRVPEAYLEPSLLALVWNSAAVRQQLEGQARTTAGIYKVNQGMLNDVRLPLPPREEQMRIVTEVERQMSFVEACERAVDAGRKRSAALRRSVLKAAFEGRLVPQDPTDEPASVLLERIRAERAAAPKAKTRRAKAKS